MPRPIRNAAFSVSFAANATENAANWLSYLLSRLTGDGLDLSVVWGEREIPLKLRVQLPEDAEANPDETNQN